LRFLVLVLILLLLLLMLLRFASRLGLAMALTIALLEGRRVLQAGLSTRRSLPAQHRRRSQPHADLS
jgi:hypothetical protein